MANSKWPRTSPSRPTQWDTSFNPKNYLEKQCQIERGRMGSRLLLIVATWLGNRLANHRAGLVGGSGIEQTRLDWLQHAWTQQDISVQEGRHGNCSLFLCAGPRDLQERASVFRVFRLHQLRGYAEGPFEQELHSLKLRASGRRPMDWNQVPPAQLGSS